MTAHFTLKTNHSTEGIRVGDSVQIKGVITAGNRYDAGLDLYEHAVLVQCDVVSRQQKP